MVHEEFILAARPDGAPGSAKRFWFRFLDGFFRRWPLFVLPLLLIIAVGVYQATKVSAKYQSTGSMNVASNPLLDSVTDARGTDVAYYETPAAATTRSINELLRTDQFINTVAKSAGLETAV